MKEYTFSVRGMSCEMCESHINDAVRNAAPVKKVKSDRRKGETIVTAEELDIHAVITAIRKLGYEANDFVQVNEVRKKSFFGLFGR